MTITHTIVNPGMFEHWGDMNEDFLVFLDSVFQGCGWFTKITSDYRDPIAQQEQIKEGHGAAEYSLHELGKAIDLRAPSHCPTDPPGHHAPGSGTRTGWHHADWKQASSSGEALCYQSPVG